MSRFGPGSFWPKSVETIMTGTDMRTLGLVTVFSRVFSISAS